MRVRRAAASYWPVNSKEVRASALECRTMGSGGSRGRGAKGAN